MRIGRNLAVLSHDWTLKDAGRRGQQLAGRIAMERWRQSAGFHDHPRLEVQEACESDCREWELLLTGNEVTTQLFKSRMNVGTTPAADEKPALPVESQLEQPCTLPR